MSPPPSGGPQLGLLPSFACSAVAACVAEITTLPLDTAKVRLQMQGGLLKAGEAPKYRCDPSAGSTPGTVPRGCAPDARTGAGGCWAL